MRHKLFFICGLFFSILLFNGCREDDTLTKGGAADVEFGADKTTAETMEPIQFTSNLSYYKSFMWYFGDDTKSGERNPLKFYVKPGKYTVTLEIDGNVNGENSRTMEVSILPAATFTMSPNVPKVDEQVQFQAPVIEDNTYTVDSYLWSFGDADNTTKTEKNPTFTYTEEGEYDVSLTVVSGEYTNTYTKTITVTKGDADPGEEDTFLYYIDTDDDAIFKMNLSTNEITKFLDITGQGGAGLAYNPDDGKIYYSDFENDDDGKIWRVNIDGSGREAIVTGITIPYNIALDRAHGRIYWADDVGNISRANLDGSDVVTGVVHNEDFMMRAVAVDDVNNKLYFYDVDLEDIYVSDLDGNGVTKIYEGTYGYGMLADTTNGWLFFNDFGGGLSRFDLNTGGNLFTYDSDASRGYGIAVDYKAGKVYWSYYTGIIKRANLDGSGVEDVLTGLGTPRGIAIADK